MAVFFETPEKLYLLFHKLFKPLYLIVLGRFQNSSVPVLNLNRNSVPVLIGYIKSLAISSGFGRFGSTVLTVLLFYTNLPYFFEKIMNF